MQDTIGPDSIQLVPLTREDAEDISTWRYTPPYDVYDMTGTDPAELLLPDAGYHAVLAGHRLIGFRSFGPDGQVPGWDYDDSARWTPEVGCGPSSPVRDSDERSSLPAWPTAGNGSHPRHSA